MTQPKLGPASKKQEMFLQSKSDITVFGGAAYTLTKNGLHFNIPL